MSEWETSCFKEHFEIGLRNGLTKPSRVRGSGLPMVNMKEIFGYDVITDQTPMELVPVSEKETESTLLEYDDLLFARQSLVESGAGKISIYKGRQPTVFESHLIRCRIDKNKSDPNFIYYLFKSPAGKGAVSTIVQQVAAAGIRGSDLQELEFSFPLLPEQKAIAAVLSSLDDKIDLLHRQNKTLEAMAASLFRQWFVEEALEDWEEVPFEQFFDFMEGPGIRNWQYTESGTPFINIRLISNGDIDISKASFVSNEEANGKYSHFHLKAGDMIVSTSGTLGKNAIVRSYHLPLILNTSVIRFRPRDGRSQSFVYQYLNSRLFQEHLESAASGSVQANFGPTHLKQMTLSKPPQEILDRYLVQADPLYEKLALNQAQIKSLEKLRDTLLPKLMSGEVRVV